MVWQCQPYKDAWEYTQRRRLKSWGRLVKLPKNGAGSYMEARKQQWMFGWVWTHIRFCAGRGMYALLLFNPTIANIIQAFPMIKRRYQTVESLDMIAELQHILSNPPSQSQRLQRLHTKETFAILRSNSGTTEKTEVVVNSRLTPLIAGGVHILSKSGFTMQRARSLAAKKHEHLRDR